jgi:1,4-alpha-glucan branching enzyme
MWKPLYESEILVKKALMEGKKDKRIIRQMLRELLILQASDWQFLITTGGAVHYAKDRFMLHKERTDTLANVLLGKAEIDEDTLAMWEDEDSLFEEIDENLYLEV